MDYSEFEDRVVLVTGASAGIGRATALAFGDAGSKVVVSDVNDEAGRETVARIRDKGVEAKYIHADVSSVEEVDALFDDIEASFGRLDYAVNNAGIEGEMGPTLECSLENWRRTLGVNLDGVFYCMKRELESMLSRADGAIVNVASVAGLSGFPGLPAYVSSKHAVVGLTKAAALDYADSGVRINAVCPGVIDTEMVQRATQGDPDVTQQYIAMEPIGRMGEPEEVADSILWLCSSKSSFVQGETLAVDGGFLAR